ncbi:oxidoreductase HTATIP2-like isoform X2 [Mercenaria mercenaria]|uniref:oxidoreductase HTATIP2-like isoform X2 n=1 Tax=Mercenaria mercenaria TaxID=6596 RepID=UPI00234EE57F|nr:oxidoreductase HTATIP2-like isoform X2 [Mercenaria mercenaria]
MSSSVTAFVLGYTGETGKALLKQLSGDNYFSNIVLIGRRQVDLGDLQIADDGRFAHFVKVDRDYVVNSAKVAKDAGCSHFQVVTAYGADKNSSILYNKTKGEVEEQLKNINFQRLSIFQPALLLGKREESRPLETFFKVISFPFTKLFPTLGSVHFDVLARAMIYNTKQQTSEKVEVIDNRKIHELSKLAK